MKEDYHTTPDEWDEEQDDYNDNDDDDFEDYGTFKIATCWTIKNPLWAYLAWECGAR